jgi:hypothetical protein
LDRTSFGPTTAAAAGATAILVKQDITHHLDGSTLGMVWALPFAGILLSIAFVPHLAPHFWDHHYGKLAAFWGMALVGPLAATQGVGIVSQELLHSLLHEYAPFIIVLVAFYTLERFPIRLHRIDALDLCLVAFSNAQVVST